MSSGIIWLASFPKSGGTWLRAFLHNLFLDRNEPSDINALDQITLGESQPQLYRAVAGARYSELDDLGIARLRPEVHRHLAELSRETTFVKTHSALIAYGGVPQITMEVTAGAIYVLRNPLDIAPSFADHFGLSIDHAIERMAEHALCFPTSDRHVMEVSGSWSRHVASWTNQSNPYLFVMRYEDMSADPVESFGALTRFLGLDPPRARLHRAIANASFAKLRAQEDRHGFRERGRGATKFFREGRAGAWRRNLTPDQVSRIVDVHRQQMRRFGYLPEGP